MLPASSGELHRIEECMPWIEDYVPIGILDEPGLVEETTRDDILPRLKMGALAYNLLHMLRRFYVKGEAVRRSIEWLIRRLIEVGARVSYHAKRWHVHVASAFPLTRHYRAVFGYG